MSLMFHRVARNHICHGYFKTDEQTLASLLSLVRPAFEGSMNVLDPCCGEGEALKACVHHLGERVNAYGIEIDKTRAASAKSVLSHVLYGDIMDCVVQKHSMGWLFLNPPYGDLPSDSLHHSHPLIKDRVRLEKLLFLQSLPWLAWGGLLTLIVPYTSLDKECCGWIARYFSKVRVFAAKTQRFKQVVIFGVRSKRVDNALARQTFKALLAIGKGEAAPEFCENELPCYTIPSSPAVSQFARCSIEPWQLAAIVKRYQGLWSQYQGVFSKKCAIKPPLLPLTSWHLSLALAGGHMNGLVVTGPQQGVLLKGGTHKVRHQHVSCHQNEDNEDVSVTTVTEQFAPRIMALDVSKASAQYGRIFSIQ